MMEFLDTIEEDFQDLKEADLSDSFIELFLYRLETGLFDFVSDFLNELERRLAAANDHPSRCRAAADCLAEHLQRLHSPLRAGVARMSSLLPVHLHPPSTLQRAVRDLLRAVLLSPAEPTRRRLLRPAAEGLFDICFLLTHAPSDVAPEARRSLDAVADFCQTFDLTRPFGDEALDFFRERARSRIEAEHREDFTTRHLWRLETWADGLFSGDAPWAILWSGGGLLCRDQVRAVVRELYLRMRIDQLFSIIVDYPDSAPVVYDIHDCMACAGGCRSEWILRHARSSLVAALKAAMAQRVLHPGVNTKDLLVVYISTVRVLRLIDRTGVAQELVCAPIAEYLRSRADVIREIIAKIIEDDGEGELAGELSSEKPGAGAFDGGGDSDNDEDEAELMLQGRSDPELIAELVNSSWLAWRPDPVDACHHEGLTRRQADLLSMVVRIYGSKEMFVNEYRNLLASRLLNSLTFDTEREIRHLEMLKWRFEEQSLHECDVMLKDIHDSRRINALVHEDLEAQGDTPTVSALILSAQFWPTFREDRLRLPPEWQRHLDRYTNVFEKLKGNRTLHWKPQLGTVGIEIDFCGHRHSMEVSPVQAAMLHKFCAQPRWSLQQLAEELDVHVSVLRTKVGMWVQTGFLVELRTDVYALAESRGEGGGEEMAAVAADETGVDAAMPSAKDIREKEFAVFWAYIEHMLTNLGRLSLERIHNMLKMFVMGSSSVAQCSRDELKAFLEVKVRDGSLTMHDEETFSLEKHS